jgi:hypothetical protein
MAVETTSESKQEKFTLNSLFYSYPNNRATVIGDFGLYLAWQEMFTRVFPVPHHRRHCGLLPGDGIPAYVT